MNAKYISLAFAAAAALLAGCAKTPIEPSEQLTDLELSYVGSTEIKSVIDGTEFPTEGEIGMFLFRDEAATQPYGESGYANVKYSYNSTKGKWTASPSMKVGSTPGYLYGYYPYSSEAANIKSVPVSSSLNGDDVMYATEQAVTDKTASQTAITMNHALARVAITIVNNGYTGDAKLTGITLADAATSVSGILDATTGTISGTAKADVVLEVPEDSQAITATGTTYECLLVPSEVISGKQDVTLTLTIDGQDKTASLSGDNGVIIARNTKSDITISLSNSGISIQEVSIEGWNVVEIGGHKVTIAEASDITANDILLKAYVDGNTVKILAIPLSGTILKCAVSGTAEVSKSRSGNIYTFTISDIGSDVTATIGYEDPITVNVSSNNSDLGTASFEGECYYGETITFRATQKSGKFIEWQDADGNKLDWENPQSITLTSDITVKAVFKLSGFLPGKFTVNAQGKKVRFSKGNLWYGDHRYVDRAIPKGFYFEADQWGGKPLQDSLWNTSHIIHFFWGDNEIYSAHEQYAYWGPKITDVLFTNKTETTPNPEFKVLEDGTEQKGIWRTLADSEWQYILYDREMTYNKPRFTCITLKIIVEGGLYAGTFIYPDDYNSEEVGSGQFTWQEINDAGIVFLPTVGYRDKYNVYGLKNLAVGYWSSTTVESDVNAARCVIFNGDGKLSISDEKRSTAHCIRLVCDDSD